MLDSLKQFLADLTGSKTHSQKHHFDVDDYRLAAAALMVHIMSIDGAIGDEERASLHQVLQRSYELGPDDTDLLIAEATCRDRESVDLYTFTSVVKHHLDDVGRLQVIRMLWEMVFADGIVHEFEDNMVWRVAELLGVSSRDRIRARKEVEAALQQG